MLYVVNYKFYEVNYLFHVVNYKFYVVNYTFQVVNLIFYVDLLVKVQCEGWVYIYVVHIPLLHNTLTNGPPDPVNHHSTLHTLYKSRGFMENIQTNRIKN